MWFKRKTKNNRRFIEQEHLLDVKLRANQVRAARFRLLGTILGVSFVILVVGGTSWFGGRFFLDRFFYQNESFAIRRIDVQTDGILNATAICKWASVRNGDNLLALDLVQVKRDLEAQPCIYSVAVERLLPNTLRLRVSEREPVAQTTIMQPRVDGTYEAVIYHLDELGFAMKPLDPQLMAQQPAVPFDRLPVLLGIEMGQVKLGKQVDSPQIRAALQLLEQFDHSPMMGLAEIKWVNVAYPEVLLATTSQNAEVTFSLSNFNLQLRRWRQIFEYYQQKGNAIASIDLSIANNLPVHLVAANTVQPMTPKPAKPQRAKRKNV
jgi:cell division septal protein FtsQ